MRPALRQARYKEPTGLLGPPFSETTSEANAREAGRFPRPNANPVFSPCIGVKVSRFAFLSAHAHATDLIARTPFLLAGGEFLSAHFAAQERSRRVPDKEYERRPQIGLRLDAGTASTLTCKPGWTPPRWGREDGVRVLRTPGKVHIDRVEVELVAPRIALRMTVTEDGVRLGRCRLYFDHRKNADNIELVAATLHKLVSDPMAAFAEHRDNCCCCRRALTDITSRLRGIGPECIRYFSHVEEVARIVRQKYRDLDAEWWTG